MKLFFTIIGSFLFLTLAAQEKQEHFLFNWNSLNLDGEWTYLQRNGTTEIDRLAEFSTNANTGYVRMGYNIQLKNQFILEPVAMIVQFNGPIDALDQINSASIKSLSGTEQIIDIGCNLHINPDLKVTLHYTTRTADSGAASEGAMVNNYYFQSGVGAIHRGDWLGLGVVAIF